VFPNGFNSPYLAPDPRVAGRVFATAGNGVYRSLDAGRNWTLVLQVFSGPGAIAIDPVNTGTLWFSSSNGVYKSTDGGDNWHLTKGLPNGSESSIVVDPRNPSTLYVATLSFLANAPLYKSNDGGENWTQLSFRPFTVAPGPPGTDLLAVDSQSNVYLLAASKLFKSSDGGVTFTQLNSAPAASMIVVNASDPSSVYLAGSNGLFRSADGGASFSKIYDTQVRAFAIDPASPATLYLSAQNPGIVKSTDGGTTWKPTGLSLPYVTFIAVDTSTPGRVYASTALDPSDIFVIKVVE
jgi:photosystem II stability/assembly factor-like uncharacterized protein